MRILILNWKDIRHPAAGGAEVFTHEVAKRWVAGGHDVTLFASRPDGLSASETIDGITIIRDGTKHGVYRRARTFCRKRASEFDVIIDEVNTRPFGAPRVVRDTPVVALV